MKISDAFSKLPKVSSGEKILLITHNDMDAAGAYIVAKTVFPNLTVLHCSNNSMSKVIRKNVTDNLLANQYDHIIACDISCVQDAEYINKSPNSKKFILLDHHSSKEVTPLNEYNWACIQSEMFEDSSIRNRYPNDIESHEAGTSLMYEYLNYLGLIPEDKKAKLLDIVFTITAYDTWDWMNLFHNDERVNDCYNFHILYDAYGLEELENKLVSNEQEGFYSDFDLLLIQIQKKKIENTIARAKCTIKTGNLFAEGKYYSMVFAPSNSCMMETFEYMKNEYPSYDYYVMYSPSSISIRSVKEDMNAGNFASERGGGGHPGAAGIPIDFKEQISRLAQSLNGQIFVDK